MSKITESARGAACCARLPGICNHDKATVVHAHLPRGGFAGTGQKCPDIIGARACAACHDALDGRRYTDQEMRISTSNITKPQLVMAYCELMALKRTLVRLVEEGVI